MSPPKCFRLFCKVCGWYEYSTGLKADLVHLKEIENSCKRCKKKYRNFRCPKCAAVARMYRVNVYEES